MKEKRYALPDDNQPKMASEPTPDYHGNAAVALPEEEVAVEDFGDEDFDWSRMPYLDSPTNAEEAIAQIKAIEEDDEKAGISYTLEEVIAECHKRRSLLK